MTFIWRLCPKKHIIWAFKLKGLETIKIITFPLPSLPNSAKGTLESWILFFLQDAPRLDLCHHERSCKHGHGNYEAFAWCHATVSYLTSGLATVAATCQHSNEHMLKVMVGEGDGSKTTEGDTINIQFIWENGEKNLLTYKYGRDITNLMPL